MLYWLAMAALVVYFAYSKGWIMTNFETISAKQAERLLENDQNITLLDVRTIEEFKTGHLRDAKLIPLGKLEENLNKLKNDKDEKIIVYCRTGSRSIAASRILEKHGFVPLNVKSGIIGLIDSGAEIIK